MTTSKARGFGDGVVKTIVIKIGGSTLGEGDSTIPDIVELWNQGARPIVVHGGGKVISDWVVKQGISLSSCAVSGAPTGRPSMSRSPSSPVS